MIILILTSFASISSHIHVITLVTLVWSFFAFVFARDKMKTIQEIKIKGITLKERISIFFKSDLSISVFLFIIFLVLIFWYYIL